MSRSRTLGRRRRARLEARLIQPIAAIIPALLIVLTAAPLFAQSGIDLNRDPAFKSYQQKRQARQPAKAIDTPAPAPAAKPVAPAAKANNIAEKPAPPTAKAHAANGNIPLKRKYPLFAVVDLYSRTLPSRDINVLSQTIWDQIYSKRAYAMISREDTLALLARQKMVPSDPYSTPLRPDRVSKTLTSDYLLFGSIGNIGDAYSLALYVYASAPDRIEATKTIISPKIEDLVQLLPETVTALLDQIGKRPVKPPSKINGPNIPNDQQNAVAPPVKLNGDASKSLTELEKRLNQRIQAMEGQLATLQTELGELKKKKATTQNTEPKKNGAEQNQVKPPNKTNGQDTEPKKTNGEPKDSAAQAAAKDKAKDKAEAEKLAIKARQFELTDINRRQNLERAVALDPENWEYVQLYLHALCCQQQYATVLEKGRAALKQFNDNPYILLMIGYAEFYQENYAAARADLERAVQANPADLQAQFYLGLTLAKLDPQAARAQLQKYIELAKNDAEQKEFVDQARTELSALQP